MDWTLATLLIGVVGVLFLLGIKERGHRHPTDSTTARTGEVERRAPRDLLREVGRALVAGAGGGVLFEDSGLARPIVAEITRGPPPHCAAPPKAKAKAHRNGTKVQHEDQRDGSLRRESERYRAAVSTDDQLNAKNGATTHE
jgi:hypothetical protein